VKLVTLVALGVGLLVLPLQSGASTASHQTQVKFRGFGTATIDGVLAAGEWEGAGRFEFQANRAPGQGGGTVPATFFVMNDSTNLYLALRVAVTELGYSAFDGTFYPSGNLANGGDILRASPWALHDLHFHQVAPGMYEWLEDTADGGTQDGASSARTSGGISVYEIAHPLDSADDRHDFSLTIPSQITFYSSFWHCVAGSCANTIGPSSSGGRLVVVSGTRVPPETAITYGPPDGTELTDFGLYVFTGTDDVAPQSEITFECKIDSGDWSSCDSPFAPAVTEDGWHTFSVRALDEMPNADPTPSQRRWRTDNQRPSKPTVASRRRGRAIELRFSATDPGTPTRRLRFRCAVDGQPFHRCARRFRVRLPAGRHVVRVRAKDPAGNESAVRTKRFLVRPSA
jgi:hypothetical protein